MRARAAASCASARRARRLRRAHRQRRLGLDAGRHAARRRGSRAAARRGAPHRARRAASSLADPARVAPGAAGRGAGGAVLLFVSAVTGFVAFPILFTLGQERTSATHGAIILAALPVFTGAYVGARAAHVAPRTRWLVGCGVALVGEAAIVDPALGRRRRGSVARRRSADPRRRADRRARLRGRRPARPGRLPQRRHHLLGRGDRRRARRAARPRPVRRGRRSRRRRERLGGGRLPRGRDLDRRLRRLVLGAGARRHRPDRDDPVHPADLGDRARGARARTRR